MLLNETAATYGLLQLTFADAIEHLAAILFHLKRETKPGLQFEEVLAFRFSDLLKTLNKELRRFNGDNENAEAIRAACKEMDRLREWRNDRVHARVRMLDGGYALFNGKTGERLSISSTECEEKVNKLIKIIVTVEAHTPHLLNVLSLEKSLEELFSQSDESHTSAAE